MKRTLFITAILVATMLTAAAQPQKRGERNSNNHSSILCRIPDLTEDQQAKIESLKIEHMKVRNLHRAEMDELKALKRKLMLADNPDVKAINTLIEKMGEKKN